MSAYRRFALVGLLLFATPAWAQGGPPPAMPVSVSEPIAKRVTQWDEYSGRFDAVATVEVRARVSGFIDKLHFKDGQWVNAGDPLFTIDKRPYEIAVESAAADVARNKAQVELADLQVGRGAALIGSRTITEADNDTRKSNLAVAKAQLKASEAAQRNAQLNLEWTEVTAPLSGRISDRKVDPGNLIQGGQSGATLLATIVSTEPIYFLFDVSEADHLRYQRLFLAGERAQAGSSAIPVRIRLADETEWKRTGKVDFVDNSLSPRSGTIRTRAVVENKDHLLTPGVFGRIQLYGGEYDALLIPDSAVISDQARKIVFVVGNDNVVQARPVTLGPLVDDLRVVRDGLKPEDKVVLDGLANPMVRPGAKVVPQKGQITAQGEVSSDAFFPFLHRPADLRVGPVAHHPDRRRHRSAQPARLGISRDRPAHRHDQRDLSRRLGGGDSRDRRHADRAGGQRRRRHAVHLVAIDRRRAADGQRHLQARRRTSTRRRCWCRTGSRSPSRACLRTCSGSASSVRKASPDLMMVVHMTSPDGSARPAVHLQLRDALREGRADPRRRRRQRDRVRRARLLDARLARSGAGGRRTT